MRIVATVVILALAACARPSSPTIEQPAGPVVPPTGPGLVGHWLAKDDRGVPLRELTIAEDGSVRFTLYGDTGSWCAQDGVASRDGDTLEVHFRYDGCVGKMLSGLSDTLSAVGPDSFEITYHDRSLHFDRLVGEVPPPAGGWRVVKPPEPAPVKERDPRFAVLERIGDQLEGEMRADGWSHVEFYSEVEVGPTWTRWPFTDKGVKYRFVIVSPSSVSNPSATLESNEGDHRKKVSFGRNPSADRNWYLLVAELEDKTGGVVDKEDRRIRIDYTSGTDEPSILVIFEKR